MSTLKELKETLFYSVPQLDGPDFDNILEEIIQLEREKELSYLTDEVIEGMIEEDADNWSAELISCGVAGAKAIRDHLKQRL